MDSSSSISAEPYDVFLSFRGPDTRKKFTGYLYQALMTKMIRTFIDDEINRGDEISSSLSNVIEEARISVVIFSEGYASSRWCLQELVEINQRRKTYGQLVIPVFYHVDPSDVRSQKGTFGDGFVKLEERFKEKVEVLQMWRTALTETANLSGWTFSDKTSEIEAKKVEDIAEDILEKLYNVMAPNYSEKLVGIESSIRYIELLLNLGSKDVLSIGICGIGGIGKTTIATAVFDKISYQFQRSFFAEKVSQQLESPNGLIQLRNELLHKILEGDNLDLRSSFTRRRLGHMKILIVFDDVTSFEEIEQLIGDPKSLGLGSRIIMTSRDKQVFKHFDAEIYEVKELSHPHDFQLFSQYAFKSNIVPEDFKQLSFEVIEYARGLPLALKVLGSSLLKKTKEQWISAISKLEETLNLSIYKVLKVSYDGLDRKEKAIFLDIACFFEWEDKNLIIKLLDASGFHPEIGISVLEDKCLITTTDNTIMMHDLLREMGREIVREESKSDLGKYSRLWHHKDVYDVLTKNMGTKAIQCISLDISEIEKIYLDSRAFSNMHNLRFFKVYNSGFGERYNKVLGFEGIDFDFPELIYFYWCGYTSKSLPPNFDPSKLVTLDMPSSNIERLWTGLKNPIKLKSIDLSESHHLREIPDLSRAKDLESLILSDCTSLLEIHSSIECLDKLAMLHLPNCRSLINFPSSIGSKFLIKVSSWLNLKVVPDMSMWQLTSLVDLSLENCSRLEILPNGFCELKSLKFLDLNGCAKLKMIPELPSNIEELLLDGTAIKKLPSSMEYLSHLKRLSLKNCSELESLPEGFGMLKSLRYLALSGCWKLEGLPNNFGNLRALERLKACGFFERRLQLLAESSQRNEGVETVAMMLPDMSGLLSLTSINLSYRNITELPNSLCELSSLHHLNLAGNNFVSLPTSIINLSALKYLNLSDCDRLQSIPRLPTGIEYLIAQGCTSLQALPKFLSLATLQQGDIFHSYINCLRLGPDVIKDIEDSVYDASLSLPLDCSICYPGSEIPEWFNFQSSGCFIELPPDSYIPDIIICVVLAFHDYQYDGENLDVAWECQRSDKPIDEESDESEEESDESEDESYESDTGTGFLTCWEDFYGPKSIESDHVILGRGFLDMYEVSDNGDKGAFIDFMLGLRETSYCKVKKCGVFVISTKECQEADAKSSHDIDDKKMKMNHPLNSWKFSNFCDGESSSRLPQICGASTTYDGQPSGFSWDLNEPLQDFDVVLTPKRSLGDYNETEVSGSGCCDGEDEPQPKRLKEFKFF